MCGSHVWKLSNFFLSKDQLSTLSKMVDLSREVEMEDSAEEDYYGSPVAIATRRLQPASTYAGTSQQISVPLNNVVSRELDKFIYDILNENIPKYISLFVLQLPLRLAAVQQCVQRNLRNTAAVRVEMKVCDATLPASVETRNLRKFAIGVSLRTKINRLLVPEVESALSQQNRLVFLFFGDLPRFGGDRDSWPDHNKIGFFWHKLNSIKKTQIYIELL